VRLLKLAVIGAVVALILTLPACSAPESRPAVTVTKTVTKTVSVPLPRLTDTQAWHQTKRLLRGLWKRNYLGFRECTNYARTMLRAALDWSLHNLSRSREHYLEANCTNVMKPYPLAFKEPGF
jgi:hypothetical protein